MNYEIVTVQEKRVAGIQIRTQNSDPNMGRDIGMAWNRFYSDGIYSSIPGKCNDKSIGLYYNYDNGVNGEYDVMVCCEVEDTVSLPDDIHATIIASGKYAKFVIHGDVKQAVGEFWYKLWAMNLDRKYGFDFEEYQGKGELDNEEIHIYISVK